MITNSGLLDDYWRTQRQKRIATGMPMSQNEVLGAVGAGLEHERQMSLIANQHDLAQQQFDLQKQQMQKADRAATVSGVVNIGQTAGNLYLGKGLLDVARARYMPGAGAANGGALLPSGAQAPYSVTQIPGMGAANTAAPGVSYGAIGTSGVPAAPAMSPWMAGGQAAGLYALQQGFSEMPWVERTADKYGMEATRQGFKWGGAPGATLGMGLDVGKKVGELVGDIVGGIF